MKMCRRDRTAESGEWMSVVVQFAAEHRSGIYWRADQFDVKARSV